MYTAPLPVSMDPRPSRRADDRQELGLLRREEGSMDPRPSRRADPFGITAQLLTLRLSQWILGRVVALTAYLHT